jgi:hypothetical protein
MDFPGFTHKMITRSRNALTSTVTVSDIAQR